MDGGTAMRDSVMTKTQEPTSANGAVAHAELPAGTLDAVVELDPQVSVVANTLLDELRAQHFSDKSLDTVARAIEFAVEHHAGMVRRSGEPFVLHPLEVGLILARIRLDSDTIAGALLHDLVEDTDVTYDDIDKAFGPRVTNLVNGVTKLSKLPWAGDVDQSKREKEAQAESLRKMFLAMVDDIGVVLIKLADRLHNMRTLQFMPPDKQQRIAQQTMEIYAPLANRLGIWQFKSELEDLSFKFLLPHEYETIRRGIDQRGASEREYVERVKTILLDTLHEAGIEATLTSRTKHIYSIYRKMNLKRRTIDEIYDLIGIRVVVEEKRDCYGALGVVHAMWHPIPGEFDDYIATPKDNFYRSIHTAVLGPEGKAVEVQIRTREMHDQAELGLAAHWRYKESRTHDVSYDRKIEWVRKLLDVERGRQGDRDFLDEVRAGLFEDRVYALTPKGQVVDLPPGATPLDFAYHVHTDLGHRCRGARVNGRIVPLTRALANGEIVEILTHKLPQPSRDWLSETSGFLASPRLVPEVRRGCRETRAACPAGSPGRGRAAAPEIGNPQAVAFPGVARRHRRSADQHGALLRPRETRGHRGLFDGRARRDHSSHRLPRIEAHDHRAPGPADRRELGRCGRESAGHPQHCRHRPTGTGARHR
jgi:RelA/SpoT family (p)ppGpp synthetase